MSTLFISDLHLDPQRPAVIRAFFDLLQGPARQSDALYILGDFFEVWVGDDDDAPLSRDVVDALQQLTASGVPVFFMHGNRDFLVGEHFCRETGCQLLPDPSVVSLYGKPVLLMHGDLLCTDDTEYMAFRQQCRSEAWQQQVLAMPLEQRRAMAAKLRQDSREAASNKAEDIMDVNAQAVREALRAHGTDLLIHGHTHRPAIHRFAGDDGELTRVVLGDWDSESWILEYQPDHRFELKHQAVAT